MTEKAFGGDTTQRVDTYPDGSHALVVKVVGGGAGAASAGASGGVIAGVDTAGTKWVMVVNSTATPATITYIKVSDGTTGTPAGEFIPDDDQADWEDTGYVLNASGQLTSETQKRGSSTRTRTWTYSTDGSGNTTATAGAWA